MKALLYLVAVSVAALLLWHDVRFFALYAFAVLLFLIEWGLDLLWKLIRLSHFSNGGKIMAVARRVGVSDEDFDRVWADMKASESKGRLDGLLKDFRDFQGR